MSYGSTFVQFDPNGKISSRLSRSHFRRGGDSSERPQKLLHYDKDFDVSLSRVTDATSDRSAVRDSMMAYSNKMKSLQDGRRVTGNTQGDPLFVKANHIPKHPVQSPKKRRPMSFDELLGRDRETVRDRGKRGKQRPLSDRQKPLSRDMKDVDTRLPVLTDRLRETGSKVQVSLVSASDLYELVDFSLSSKSTRVEHMQRKSIDAVESSTSPWRRNKQGDTHVQDAISRNNYDKFQRTRECLIPKITYASDLSNVNTVPSSRSIYHDKTVSSDKIAEKSVFEESSQLLTRLPSIYTEILKRRPNRSKRMKLQDPSLEDIPEDASIKSGELSRHTQIEISRRVMSPPQHMRSQQSTELFCKTPLGAILEHNDKNNSKTTPVEHYHNEMLHHEYDASLYRSVIPDIGKTKTTKKMLVRDDGDVRIEVTQCPPNQEQDGAKLRAQRRIKKLIYMRDGQR